VELIDALHVQAFRSVLVEGERAADASVLDLWASDRFGVRRQLIDAGELHERRRDVRGRRDAGSCVNRDVGDGL
jgi:hypothetical protein